MELDIVKKHRKSAQVWRMEADNTFQWKEKPYTKIKEECNP